MNKKEIVILIIGILLGAVIVNMISPVYITEPCYTVPEGYCSRNYTQVVEICVKADGLPFTDCMEVVYNQTTT